MYMYMCAATEHISLVQLTYDIIYTYNVIDTHTHTRIIN